MQVAPALAPVTWNTAGDPSEAFSGVVVTVPDVQVRATGTVATLFGMKSLITVIDALLRASANRVQSGATPGGHADATGLVRRVAQLAPSFRCGAGRPGTGASHSETPRELTLGCVQRRGAHRTRRVRSVQPPAPSRHCSG